MEKILTFLDSFFPSETEALEASIKPNLEDFNKKLRLMNDHLVDSLANSFGMIPADKLKSQEFYDRYKDFPPANKRYLFRIDEFESEKKDSIFACFVSKSNPQREKISNLLIIKDSEDGMKIYAQFVLSKRSRPLEWRFTGGDTAYRTKLEDRSILNADALGEKVATFRLLEPSNSEESMEIYNQE